VQHARVNAARIFADVAPGKWRPQSNVRQFQIFFRDLFSSWPTSKQIDVCWILLRYFRQKLLSILSSEAAPVWVKKVSNLGM